MLTLLLLCLALNHPASAQTSLQWSTLEAFLLITSMPSETMLFARSGAFANDHITVIVANMVTNSSYTYTSSFSAAVETVTTPKTGGCIAFAFNDTFYSHRLWPGFSDAVPNDSAFFDAQCTAPATPAETWECSSWSVTVSVNSSISDGPYTTPVTMYPSSNVMRAENLYTISGVSLFTAPPLSSRPPGSNIAMSESEKASSGTIGHVPVQTSNATAIVYAGSGIIPMACLILSTIAFMASL